VAQKNPKINRALLSRHFLKKWMFFVTIAFPLLVSCERSSAEGKRDESQNVKEKAVVEQTAIDYMQAFASHDPQKVASFWSAEATYANPMKGVSIQGRKALEEEFALWFEEKHADKLELFIHKISFPAPDKALESGSFSVTFSDGTEPLENAFSASLVKEGGRWLFNNMRQIYLGITPLNYEHLKELEWLVGDWVDKDQDVEINTITNWKYKNFIVQRFTMDLFDEKILEGQQIIGWDPILKKIRSWIFDSDGGFGEGKWYQKGNGKWFVKISYTLANGSKASAVHIYQRVNDDTYTWASEGRDIDGTIQPNIPPSKIVRQKSTKENL
jgi:uncharacterized protein (TIGR02246 family)